MKCQECGGTRFVTVKHHVPTCLLCESRHVRPSGGDRVRLIDIATDICVPGHRARGDGEFGDIFDELDLESLSVELNEPDSQGLDATQIGDLWITPEGTFPKACFIDI